MEMIYRGRKIDVGEMGTLLEMACLGKRGGIQSQVERLCLARITDSLPIAIGEKAGHRSR